MGCIASKQEQNQDQDQTHNHQQKLLEAYTKLSLSFRLLSSRATDLRRRRRRLSGDATWLLAGSDDVVPAPQVEMGSVHVAAAAQAVLNLMLVFPEGEMDTWQTRIGYVERSILPVTNRLVRFEYEDIVKATKNFHKERLLGRGAVSRVYRGHIRFKSVAIKSTHARTQDNLHSFCRELATAGSLQALNPKYVVKLLGFCVDEQGLFLVYEFVCGGTLDARLHGGKGGKVMKWEERYKVAVGVAKAVRFLHFGTNKCVIHRDIKPSNILLSSKNVPKLCDFGMATCTHEPSLPFLCKSVKGTFGYLAPEYFQHGKLSDKTDVYSFGVVLLELITGRKAIDRSLPPGDENLVLWARPILQQGESAISKLTDPNLKFHKSVQSAELARMVRAATACLSSDESRRPNITQIIALLQDRQLAGSDWQGLKHSGCLSGLTGQLAGSDWPGLKQSGCLSGLTGLRSSEDLRKCHLALAMLGVSDEEEKENRELGSWDLDS